MNRFSLVLALALLVAVPTGAQVREDVGDGALLPLPPIDSGAARWRAPEAIMWDNGPLVTHPGTGAGGADESTVQSLSLSMTTLGFGAQVSFANRVADDFTISPGDSWHIDTITIFTYQTGSTTSSPITGIFMQIWDGIPGNPGSTVVWGDLTTNIMASTGWTNIYRVSETTGGGTTRPIMAVDATVDADLGEGTYWIDFQMTGSASFSGPWCPPITILGQTTTGDAVQFTGTWAGLVDGGTLAPQGIPFVIDGVSLRVAVPDLSRYGMLFMAIGILIAAAVALRRLS